jgi:hypothetical protein
VVNYIAFFFIIWILMSKLLFSLRGVPEDEAIEIRSLLNESELEYYETSSGNWGVSMPALWVVNNEDFEEAQNLLNEYHQNRAVSHRKLYERLKKEGKHLGVKDVFLLKPFRFMVYIAGVTFILYLSIRMLFEFGL